MCNHYRRPSIVASYSEQSTNICRITTCNERCINRVHLTFSVYTNCQNRPCGKEFNTTAFVNLLIEKKIVRNRPIRNKNCLWRPCLSTDRDEMCNIYRRPSIVASYQVSVHLAKRFKKRRFDKIGQKNIKLVLVASPLRKYHYGERARTGWLGIRIMCPSGATYLPNDCC
jgi:hypothetical protein